MKNHAYNHKIITFVCWAFILTLLCASVTKIKSRLKYTAMPVRNGTLTKWILLKWGHFDRAKPTLKIMLVSWTSCRILKGFRLSNAENLESVGQRATKLLAVKVGGLKKKSAGRPRPHSNQSARVRTPAPSNHSQSLMAGNFAGLWPADPKFSALKVLNPFKIV